MISRDLKHLNIDLHCKAILIEDLAKERLQNYIVVPICTYRSGDVQDVYYLQGRTSLDRVNEARRLIGLDLIIEKENKIITWAKAGESAHNVIRKNGDRVIPWSCAVDWALIRYNDKNVKVCEWNLGADLDEDGMKDWLELGMIAEEVGLVWGGRWKKGKAESPHAELPNWKSLEK